MISPSLLGFCEDEKIWKFIKEIWKLFLFNIYKIANSVLVSEFISQLQTKDMSTLQLTEAKIRKPLIPKTCTYKALLGELLIEKF